MGLRQKLGTFAAGTLDVTGRAARATARSTVAVAAHPTTKWIAKTGCKAVVVGAGTAAGMAIGGPVGAAVAATIAGTIVASGPPSAQPPAQA